MEGEWSCYRGGHFNGGRMDNGPYGGGMEMESLKEGEWSCYSLMESMVMLLRWPVLMDREWSFYGGGQFNGGGMDMLQRWPV